jgi:hypothetical protein
MEDIDMEVLVKEERWPKKILILAAVLPPIFLKRQPTTSLFWCFVSTPSSLVNPRGYL